MLFDEPSYYTNGDQYLEEFIALTTAFAKHPNQPNFDWQNKERLIMSYNLWVRLMQVENIRIPKAEYQMLFPLIFDIHSFIDNHELTERFKTKHSQNEALLYYAHFISSSLHQSFKPLIRKDVFIESAELKQLIGKEEYFFNEPKYQKSIKARRLFYQQFNHDQKLQTQFNYNISVAYKATCDFLSNN